MIVIWNTRYMAQALDHLVAERSIPPGDVERLSPVLHGHINFLRRYRFDLAEDVDRPGVCGFRWHRDPRKFP